MTIQVPRFVRKEADDDTSIYPSPLHTIRVESILTDDEASTCLKLAMEYGNTKWQAPDKERHSNYFTCDFPIDEESHDLKTYLDETVQFQDKMWNRLSQVYGLWHCHG